MSITYCRPEVADAEAVAELHVTCWREAYSGIIPISILENVDLADRIAHWRSYLGVGGHPTVMAHVDGEPAGFIRAGRMAEPLAEGADGHIFALYVLRRFHRRGIGRRLMSLAAAEWLEEGGKAFSVGVLTANQGALAFYEALGARYLRGDSYEWDGHTLPETLLVFDDLEGLSRLA
jgi:ribosomal protein S18 acetylase RimI-like enzyme